MKKRNLKGLIKLAAKDYGGMDYGRGYVPTYEERPNYEYNNGKYVKKSDKQIRREREEAQEVWDDTVENWRRIGRGTLTGLGKTFVNAGEYIPLLTNPYLWWQLGKDPAAQAEYFKPYQEAKKMLDDYYISHKRPYHNSDLESGLNQFFVNTSSSALASLPTAYLGGELQKGIEAAAASAQTIPAVAKTVGAIKRVSDANKATRAATKLLVNGMKQSKVTPGHLLLAPLWSDTIMDSVTGHGDVARKDANGEWEEVPLYNEDGTYNQNYWEGRETYAPYYYYDRDRDEWRTNPGLPVRGAWNIMFNAPSRLALRWYDWVNGKEPGTADYVKGDGAIDEGTLDRGPINPTLAAQNSWLPLDIADQLQDDEANYPEFKYIDPWMALPADVGALLPGKYGKWGGLVGGAAELAWPWAKSMMYKSMLERQAQDRMAMNEFWSKEKEQEATRRGLADFAFSLRDLASRLPRDSENKDIQTIIDTDNQMSNYDLLSGRYQYDPESGGAKAVFDPLPNHSISHNPLPEVKIIKTK